MGKGKQRRNEKLSVHGSELLLFFPFTSSIYAILRNSYLQQNEIEKRDEDFFEK